MADDVDVSRYRSRSLWLDLLEASSPGSLRPRAALDADLQCDVAIAGAGLTGLWTAYYLAVADPSLRIVVVERDIAGFGASGRNGGWASAGIAGSPGRYARRHGIDAVRRATRATNEAVDEIGRVVAAEGIECHFRKQGSLTVATSEPQRMRLAAAHEAALRNGTHNADDEVLDADGVSRFATVHGVVAGAFTPHAAGMDPARLTRGLASACERRGVRIVEQTPVVGLQPGLLRTANGLVRAEVVLRTTESYTVQLPGHRLDYLPLTSLMIATESLPASVWDELGWPRGMTMKDKRHLFFYAQRTADDRIAIGGRGAPYAIRRPMDPSREVDPGVGARLANVIRTHFPAAAEAAITHRWGGTLAVPRDWTCAVQFDPVTRTGWAGGYSGHGVVAASLSGRTLADLVLGRDTELRRMPWVDHRSRRWEPEPLRWIASRSIVQVLGSADRHEDATGTPARRVRLIRRWLPPS